MQLRTLFALVVMLVAQALARAQEFGLVDAAVGTTTVTTADGASSAVSLGQRILVGQTLQTQAGAELHIATNDGGFLALRPNTLFKVLQYNIEKGDSGTVEMSLLKGALRSITGWIGKLNPKGYKVVTPTATVGIRGTDHETTVLEDVSGRDRPGTYDSVNEGSTTLRTPQGETSVQAGQHAFAARGAFQPPRILAARPGFLANRRTLRLENRIHARKQQLSAHVQRAIERHRAGQPPEHQPLTEAAQERHERAEERREAAQERRDAAQQQPRRSHRGGLHR
ncbi:MAG: FecR domain-containing protein [Rhodoferax sp.]